MCNEGQWKTVSEISVHLVWVTKEPNAMAELISMPWNYQQSMESSPQRIQDCESDVVDTFPK